MSDSKANDLRQAFIQAMPLLSNIRHNQTQRPYGSAPITQAPLWPDAVKGSAYTATRVRRVFSGRIPTVVDSGDFAMVKMRDEEIRKVANVYAHQVIEEVLNHSEITDDIRLDTRLSACWNFDVQAEIQQVADFAKGDRSVATLTIDGYWHLVEVDDE